MSSDNLKVMNFKSNEKELEVPSFSNSLNEYSKPIEDKPIKKIKTTKGKYKLLKVACTLSFAAGLGAKAGIEHLQESFHRRDMISRYTEPIGDFLMKNTTVYNPNGTYGYNEPLIAGRIINNVVEEDKINYDELDVNIYVIENYHNSYITDRVISSLDMNWNSLDEYIEDRGFENIEDFEEKTENRIIKEAEYKDAKNNLEELKAKDDLESMLKESYYIEDEEEKGVQK